MEFAKLPAHVRARFERGGVPLVAVRGERGLFLAQAPGGAPLATRSGWVRVEPGQSGALLTSQAGSAEYVDLGGAGVLRGGVLVPPPPASAGGVEVALGAFVLGTLVFFLVLAGAFSRGR
jgi:hypothetical protein